jgi:hypothetical protein
MFQHAVLKVFGRVGYGTLPRYPAIFEMDETGRGDEAPNRCRGRGRTNQGRRQRFGQGMYSHWFAGTCVDCGWQGKCRLSEEIGAGTREVPGRCLPLASCNWPVGTKERGGGEEGVTHPLSLLPLSLQGSPTTSYRGRQL